MCLYIKRDQTQNEKDLNKWFGNRKKFAYVYKILLKEDGESFYRSLNYNNFIWDFKNQKTFQVGREPKPTIFELNRERINWGLHVYTSLKIAQENQFYFEMVTVKFRANKEDIVAIENDGHSHRYKNFIEAVCKKLTFVKVMEERK
jgi:hypothetical protein